MYYKITNGAVTIDTKTIIEEINIEIKEKDHIALIGRNGAGKTTLLKALINNEYLEEGTGDEKFNIFKSGKFTIGYLNQNNKIDDTKTLLEVILNIYSSVINIENKLKRLEAKLESGATTKEITAYEETLEAYKLNGGYNYQKEYLTALNKFGFTESDYHKLLQEFSGGEKTKILFLKLLLSKPDLLLLDEPTNHLDIDTIIWLEEYLKRYPKTFLIVSHDRMFLNNITTKTIEIEYGKTEYYPGNYDYYEKEKTRRYEKALKDYEYQSSEIKRLQRIADRFRYKPSKASMAMSKLKMIERMEKLSPPEKENLRTFNIKWDNFSPSGRLVLKVDNLVSGYKTPLNTCTFELLRSDILGIIGPNGTGKSTILKTIMNLIPSLGGKVEFGHNLTIGYFDQEQNSLDNAKTVYEEFSSTFPDMNDFEIRKTLAAFLFSGEDLENSISNLSGGEKVRLELCEVITKKPNFLILDEPTNHLDILSKIRLETILSTYPGTILFVSHDRMFIKKIAKSLLVLKNNTSTYYNYTYDEYLERVKESNIPITSEETKKERAVKPKPDSRNITKELKKLETEITHKEKRIKELQIKTYSPEIYNDYEKSTQINTEISLLEKELSELMTKWENLNIKI